MTSIDDIIENYKNAFNLKKDFDDICVQSVALYYWKFDRLLNAKLRDKNNYDDLLKTTFNEIKNKTQIPDSFINWFTLDDYMYNPWLKVVEKINSISELDIVVNKLDKNLRKLSHQNVELRNDLITWRCLSFKDKNLNLRYTPYVNEYIATSLMIEASTNIFCKFSSTPKIILIECHLDKSTLVVPVGLASVVPENEITIIPGNEIYNVEIISKNIHEIINYLKSTTGVDISQKLIEHENITFELYRMFFKRSKY